MLRHPSETGLILTFQNRLKTSINHTLRYKTSINHTLRYTTGRDTLRYTTGRDTLRYSPAGATP